VQEVERRATRRWQIQVPLITAAVLAVGGCMNPPAEGAGASDLSASESIAPESSASQTASSTAQDACPASGAQVSVGPVDAASGTRAVTLSLTNCGAAPYPVEGYPGLELLDAEQQAIDVQAVQEPDPVGHGAVTGPAPLTLAPGQQAQAVLLWRNTVELGAANTPGSYVAVTPTPAEEPQIVALEVDLGTTGRLTVGPWTPAA
jgi:hypothetical protein